MLRSRLAWKLLLLLLCAWLAVSAVLFVWPHEDRARRSDAIVVLSGGRNSRLDPALALIRERVAPVLVISDGLDPLWPKANRLCRRGASFRVICFTPDPDSTRGEAEAVAALAARRGWRSLVVVTSTYHVTRARLLFRRCFRGRLAVTGTSYSLWHLPEFVVTEWGKLIVQLTVMRRC